MRTYLFVILFLTLAEILFTLIYYLIRRELDEVIIGGLFIHLASIVTCTIAYIISKYRRQKKKMIDDLPG